MAKSSRLLIDEEPLQVIPSLAVKLGLNRAIFLQQLHYWLQKSDHSRDGRKWIYNTFDEWAHQFPFWSSEAVRKIARQLQEKKLIKTTAKYNHRKSDRTLWYTIDYENFNKLLDQPDESTEGVYQPDESTEQPDKSTDLQPDKSTQRYQRLPETTTENSVRVEDGSSTEKSTEKEPKPVRPVPMGKFGISELMDRVNAARAQGKSIHDPVELGAFGRLFKARSKRSNIDTLLVALDYMVAKASGDIPGEPKAWCGLDTALDIVDAGWTPGQSNENVSRLRHDGTPEPLVALLEASGDLSRYADVARQFDFTSATNPPWKIATELGGTKEEQQRNLTRIRSVVGVTEKTKRSKEEEAKQRQMFDDLLLRQMNGEDIPQEMFQEVLDG